jgi:class 3 adenylate cyclase/tetratricopeptide (TPR) repeat protein
MQCPACGEALRNGARYCTACGTPLPLRCLRCNEVNPPVARFCARCGADILDVSRASATVPSEGERRQLSVMLCDLVDSTPMSTRLDPEELSEVIRSYQARAAAVIKSYDGFIARYVGDGILSYFGWPESKEADAERAVRAALAVVSAFTDSPVGNETLQLRIGVATGTVVVGEPIGSGASAQQTAVGITPNLAARLEEIAGPNGIAIDTVTRRLIGDLFRFEELGGLILKGFSAPVRVWRVLGERPEGDRFSALHSSRLVSLVDREDELALLERRWDQAKAGQGQLVLLTGEPGIGKSRLVAELRARLCNEPRTSLRYFCSPHHQTSPLHPLIANLQYEAGFATRDSADDRLRKLVIALRKTDASAEEVALLADLLGVPAGEPYPKLDLSPQRKKEKTYEAVTRHMTVMAKLSPLLLLVEDLHWADPSSVELLDRLVNALPDLPILLIVSYRPEFSPPWAGQANTTLIALSRLNRRDATQLATQVMIGHGLRAMMIERIVTQSDGVPLFIEELTKSVLENVENIAIGRSLPPVPETLQTLLTARLDRLPAAKRVAQVGAAIGREFSRLLLSAVLPIDEEQLAVGLEELVASGLASRRGEHPDIVYTFKHALVQGAIYDGLLRRRRAEIHARIVAVAESDTSLGISESGLLGYHCAQAGLLAKAASYYRIAGGRSAERAAVAETRIYLERGLQLAEHLTEGPDRHRLEAELLIALGRILMATKGPNDPEASLAFRRAAAVCRELHSPQMLARALYSLAITAETRADLRVAQTIGKELLGLAEESGDLGIAIAAHVRLGIVEYYRGHFIAARDHLQEALTLCSTSEQLHDSAIAANPDAVAEVHLSATFAHLGCVEQAIACGKSAIQKAKESGVSSPAHALVLSVWWRTLEVLRNEEQCAECAAVLVALAEVQGFSFLHAAGQCQLGWVTARQGDISKGLALLSEGLASLRTLGAVVQPEVAKYLYSDVLALSGQHTEALAMMEDVLQFSHRTDACWLDAELHRKIGKLLLAGVGADGTRAELEFRRAIDIAQSQAAKLLELRAATSLARLWSIQGKRSAAWELLQPICGQFGKDDDIPDVREASALLVDLELDSAPT